MTNNRAYFVNLVGIITNSLFAHDMNDILAMQLHKIVGLEMTENMHLTNTHGLSLMWKSLHLLFTYE